MTDKQKIIQLIEQKEETDICDFKQYFYHEKKKSDMIKDILSFCNGTVSGHKYIVFNIENDTWQVSDMDVSTLPDVSEINNLIREYCEPHINISLNSFKCNDIIVPYIKIDGNNLNKPYLVKKNFERSGKQLLLQGQIFIRRGANNFIATRSDLDEIFSAREKCILAIENNIISRIDVVENNKKSVLFSLDFVFENSLKQNFIVKKAELILKTTNRSIQAIASYVADNGTTVFSASSNIAHLPLDVQSNSIIQKTIFFHLSDTVLDYFKKSLQQNAKLEIFIQFTGANKSKIVSMPVFCTIN